MFLLVGLPNFVERAKYDASLAYIVQIRKDAEGENKVTSERGLRRNPDRLGGLVEMLEVRCLCKSETM